MFQSDLKIFDSENKSESFESSILEMRIHYVTDVQLANLLRIIEEFVICKKSLRPMYSITDGSKEITANPI